MSRNPTQLDEQQAQLVARLRAADGAPVTFEELRRMGIENPALLCYELAAVGLPVTQTTSPAEGMPALSVRLEPDGRPDPGAGETGEQQPPSELSGSRLPGRPVETAGARVLASLAGARLIAGQLTRPARGALGGRRPRPAALAAMLALLVALTAVIAIALGDLANNQATRSRASRGAARGVADASRTRKPRRATPPAGRAHPQAAQTATGVVPPPARVSLAAARELEARGHQLLADGSYASAIPALASAIRASGQSLEGCAEPASEACLTFAYALYDLGRALRLEGHHAQAVSILSERLRIDNQRPTVRHELELARGARA